MIRDPQWSMINDLSEPYLALRTCFIWYKFILMEIDLSCVINKPPRVPNHGFAFFHAISSAQIKSCKMELAFLWIREKKTKSRCPYVKKAVLIY